MPKPLKELLKKDLTKKQLEILPTSFDVIGDILIFQDFPEKLSKKESLIASKILENFNNINVVCKKTKNFGGKFRTPKLKILAGQRRKETIHKENNIRVKLNVENVYFSSRLGHERERINSLIKKGESVLVMFSGVGVYPINISKNSQAKEIYGVEINPVGHKYGLENLSLNKIQNVKLFNGDVLDILPKIRKKFDHVLMPLPKSAEDFLDIALKKVNNNGFLHFYDFLNKEDFNEAKDKVRLACKNNNKKCRIINLTKCGSFGPGKFRVCVDARIKW